MYAYIFYIYYTLIGRRRVQYCIYFVEAEILVEAGGRDQYFCPRQNKYNIGQGGGQISVLLYPSIHRHARYVFSKNLQSFQSTSS